MCERGTGFEPETCTVALCGSTTELTPHYFERSDTDRNRTDIQTLTRPCLTVRRQRLFFQKEQVLSSKFSKFSISIQVTNKSDRDNHIS